MGTHRNGLAKRTSALGYLAMGSLFSLFLLSRAIPQSASTPTKTQSHDAWLRQALTKIKTLKPGCTRSQLSVLFTTEGGMFTQSRRTFVYRDCRIIKIDVTFGFLDHAKADRDGRILHETNDDDPVLSISEPYLQWSRID